MGQIDVPADSWLAVRTLGQCSSNAMMISSTIHLMMNLTARLALTSVTWRHRKQRVSSCSHVVPLTHPNHNRVLLSFGFFVVQKRHGHDLRERSPQNEGKPLIGFVKLWCRAEAEQIFFLLPVALVVPRCASYSQQAVSPVEE